MQSPNVSSAKQPEVELPTQYQQFIHLSRYSRFLPEEGRRETWQETVDRYVSFMCDEQCAGKIDKATRMMIRHAMLNCEVMPSMRALMTAGPALRRDHTCNYNCSFVAMRCIEAFAEVLYILMSGTGVGFSCERRYVDQLPCVPKSFTHVSATIEVEDSKIGWSEAYLQLLKGLWQGHISPYDMSKVRPAGARLKTMGGRASGPAPLKKLFEYTMRLLKAAAGRKLRSDEVHNLVCNVAEIVVVGGVRRCVCAVCCFFNKTNSNHPCAGQHSYHCQIWKTNECVISKVDNGGQTRHGLQCQIIPLCMKDDPT